MVTSAGGTRFLCRRILLGYGVLLFCSLASEAFPLACQISTLASDPASLKMRCLATSLPRSGKVELRFKDQFAGIEHLGQRVSQLRIIDDKEKRSLPEIFGAGIYRLPVENEGQISFEYLLQLNLVPGASSDPGRYALVSTMGVQSGVFLPADALPQICFPETNSCEIPAVRLKFQLPEDWQIATLESLRAGTYELHQIDKAVFILGKLRVHTINVDRTQIQTALAGEHKISDVQSNVLISTLVREQIKMLKEVRRTNYLVSLLPFPVPVSGLRSAALTRGQNVIMFLNSDAQADRTLKLYQRHVAHELLHFYLPETFAVREYFDWFWEGFVRYLGLVTLQRLHLITTRELLDEMENEYFSYQSNPVRRTVSLLAASPQKFASAATYDLIYHKGTLVAWLFDLEIRRQTDGRSGVLEPVQKLYETFGHRAEEIGNREVLAALRKAGKLDDLIRDDLEGTKEINLATVLKLYGLNIENNAGRTHILLPAQLKEKQKRILGP